jgi:hypothetical protein
MPVVQIWQALCDGCVKERNTTLNQSDLLKELRREGWKIERIPSKSGYTRLVVLCPSCQLRKEKNYDSR